MGAVEERELIRHALEDHRRDFRTAVQQLKEAARSATDPREPIRERPREWMLGAVALGLWLGWQSWNHRGG